MARPLNREDRALWDATTQAVAPLRKRSQARPAPRSEPAEAPPSAGAARRAAPAALPPLVAGGAPGVDRRTAEKQRRGRLAIEGRLDLHGLTQAEAHRALVRFVADCRSRGLRNLLVITGKGSGADAARGVLKAAVPRWLNESDLRPAILSFAWAQPRHGGGGALYLLLRRRQ